MDLELITERLATFYHLLTKVKKYINTMVAAKKEKDIPTRRQTHRL